MRGGPSRPALELGPPGSRDGEKWVVSVTRLVALWLQRPRQTETGPRQRSNGRWWGPWLGRGAGHAQGTDRAPCTPLKDAFRVPGTSSRRAMTSLEKSGPRVEVGTEAGSVWGVGGPGCRGRALGCTGPLRACRQSHRRGHGGPGTEWRTEAEKEAKRRRGTKTRRPDDRRGGREEGDGADVGHAGRPRGDGEGPRPFHSAPCLPEFARKRFLPVLRAANLFLLRDNFTHPREQTSALGIKPRGANRHAGKSACVDAPGYAKSPSNFHRAGHGRPPGLPFLSGTQSARTPPGHAV